MDYPKRPQLFALRFTRIVCRSCAAQEISGDGVALLVAVAHVEDSKRYTGAVTFWNDQLLPILGLRSWSALERVRNRCIAAGWLHYEPGGKSRPGRYWVTIPARLEVLGQEPLGVNPGDFCTSENDDHSLRETRDNRGGNDLLLVCTSEIGVVTEGQPRDNRGTTANHSTLLPSPNPIPLPNAAEPALDPDEQDLTAPSKTSGVPRLTDPRGTENDMADPVHGLGVWVRWRATDASRQAENAATIRSLIADHGAGLVQQVAERLQRAGAPDRDRKPGAKVWVDELLPAILGAQERKRAPVPAPTATKPEVVRQAHALLARHGASACRVALGWSPTTASTDDAMRAALEREPVARDLLDAFAAPVTP